MSEPVVDLFYVARGGAHVASRLPQSEAFSFLETHRGKARAEREGEVVGAVEYRPEMFEDGRTKWWWWHE